MWIIDLSHSHQDKSDQEQQHETSVGASYHTFGVENDRSYEPLQVHGAARLQSVVDRLLGVVFGLAVRLTD